MSDKLREALELVLLFHSGGPWNIERHRRWVAIAGHEEVTAKAMCDHVRKALDPPAIKTKTPFINRDPRGGE